MPARTRERQQLILSRVTLFVAVGLSTCVADLTTKWWIFQPIVRGQQGLGEGRAVIDELARFFADPELKRHFLEKVTANPDPESTGRHETSTD